MHVVVAQKDEDTQNYTHKYPAPYRKENPVKITKETNVILGY